MKESETKLKNIIENSTNLFYTHSADGEITFISPQVRHVLGYEPEEVMQHWTDFVTDNPINQEALEFTEKAVRTGERQPTYELEMQRKDGKKIIVEVRESPILENGKVVSIVGSLTDITERKLAEEELKKRLNDAHYELKQMKHYDYLIINDHFKEALKELKAVIISERCKIKEKQLDLGL